MGDTQDVVEQLAATIREAAKEKRPLCIRGGGTKDFYGGEVRGDNLYTGNYRGIVEYEPTELVITARAGTPLAEVEAALRERGQMPLQSRRISVRFPHRYPTLACCAALPERRRAHRAAGAKGKDGYFGRLRRCGFVRPPSGIYRRSARLRARCAHTRRQRYGTEVRRTGDEKRQGTTYRAS